MRRWRIQGAVAYRWMNERRARAFALWKLTWSEARRHGRVMQTIIRRWEGLAVWPAFDLWSEHAIEMADAADQAKEGLLEWFKQSLKQAWSEWKTKVKTLNRHLRAMRTISRRWERILVYPAFRGWAETTKITKK
eukprot:3934936-Rhodomonas_salina.1